MIKKILVLILIIVFSTKLSLADVILPGQRIVTSCIKIDNLSSFPEIVLIALEKGPLIKEPEGYKIYQIAENQCLKFQYKMNRISIFWNFKGNLKPQEDKILLKDIELGSRMIDESDPLIEEEIIYSLTKTDSGEIKIYKSKEIKKFKDGQIKITQYNDPYKIFPSPTITYPKVLTPTQNINILPSILPSPKTTKTSFFFKKTQNIFLKFICWIGKFFNFSCD